MNWDAIGAIGEVVGAVAVVISVVYLAVQIRTNTRSVKASAWQSTNAGSASLHQLLAADREMAELALRGAEDAAVLDTIDQFRLDSLLTLSFNQYQTAFLQSRLLRLDEDLVDTQRRYVESMIANSGIRRWWSENSMYYDRTFRRVVDEIVAKQDDIPSNDGSVPNVESLGQ